MDAEQGAFGGKTKRIAFKRKAMRFEWAFLRAFGAYSSNK